MIGDSHRTAPLPCPGCAKGLDGHMEAGPGEPRPTAGAVSICVYCSTISVYIEIGSQLGLRRATDTELDRLLRRQSVQHAINVAREFRERRNQ